MQASATTNPLSTLLEERMKSFFSCHDVKPVCLFARIFASNISSDFRDEQTLFTFTNVATRV